MKGKLLITVAAVAAVGFGLSAMAAKAAGTAAASPAATTTTASSSSATDANKSVSTLGVGGTKTSNDINAAPIATKQVGKKGTMTKTTRNANADTDANARTRRDPTTGVPVQPTPE